MPSIFLDTVNTERLLALKRLRRPCVHQWFSKCGPWAGSISFTWGLVRNADPWSPLQTH